VARVYPSAPFVYAIHIERWHSSRVPAYCREGWPVDFDGIRRGQLPGRLWAEPCSSQARRVPRRVRGWCRKAQDLLSLGNFNRRVAGGPERIDTNIPPEPFLGLHAAPVVLLMANPGWDRRDDDIFRQPRVHDANSDSVKAPGISIYNLWDDLSGTTSGGWWRSPGRDGRLDGLRDTGG
jgi:hypothetical protein